MTTPTLADLLAYAQQLVNDGKYPEYAAGILASLQRLDAIDKVKAPELEAEIERLHQVCRDAYEVWAGSEGIPKPETAAEAYVLQLLEQMLGEVKKGLK